MSLAELIRGKRFVGLATAIPAIPATHHQELAGTVARIATVAVANPTEAKNDDGNSSKNSNNSSSKPREQEYVHYRWRLHLADRDPMEVCFSPEATRADALDAFPEALAAEPWPEERTGPPTTICIAGNAKPGMPLGYPPKI
jgi:hypothetical protein